MRKNRQKTQLIKLCTKDKVKKKQQNDTKKEQNETKERAAKMCYNALTST